MVDAQHGHGDLFRRRGDLLPELGVAKRLRCAPQDLWREAELDLVVAVGIEARGDVGEVVVAVAVVAAAAAVGGVADGAWALEHVDEGVMLTGNRWDSLILGGP